MRILFIGNKNLQNEAILEIIKNEDKFKIIHVLPIEVEDRMKPNPHIYEVTLIDLNSLSYGPEVIISLIKSSNLSKRTIAIHEFTDEKLIQPIMEAGADFCFSINSGKEELVGLFQTTDL